ncbi:MAG: malonic semialdehyde reductase [Gammaproteobacteria bacterium]|nr:malonic semialdehyde reductase [Gammaproteobacteria bacterium]
MGTILSNEALDTLFREARSHNGWQDTPVTDEQLHQIYDLMKMGPTAANACPARLLFIKSAEAKERLKPCLSEGNVEKSMSAPVVAVIGMDMEFYEQLPKLFPHTDARSWYVGKPEEVIHTAAFRNSTLQGAYFMLAARSLGLDCGPMSGFDAEKLEAEFFPDGKIKANFICAIGHGDASKIFARHPRLEFDEACSIS